MAYDTDVLIVGAGPAGLSLANDLALRGVNFRIIDALPARNPRSRAPSVQSRTLEALDHLGLAQPILEAAQNPQPPCFLFSAGRQVARLDFGSLYHRPFPYQLVVWQQSVERILEEALISAGREVERNTRLLSYDTDEEGVIVRVLRENISLDTISARWIVGCDGAQSTVRQGAGLEMEGETAPGQFWMGEFDVDWGFSKDAMYEWWHPEGMASAVYVDLNEKWHLTVQSRFFDEDQPTVDQFRETFAEHSGESEVFISNPYWMGTCTDSHLLPKQVVVGRAILAGDAAHCQGFAACQGMNVAIQDALNLGWKLALAVQNQAASSLLHTYEEERLGIARRSMETGRRFQMIQAPRGRLVNWLAGGFFNAMSRIPVLEEATAHRVGMLDVAYPRSSLSKGPGSGVQMPDAPCRLDGRPSSVFEVLRGTSFCAFLWTGDHPNAAQLRRMLEIRSRLEGYRPNVRTFPVFPTEAATARFGEEGHRGITDGGQYLREALSLGEPELILVRPDGYIGLRDSTLEARSVEDYLHLILARTIPTGARPVDQVSLM